MRKKYLAILVGIFILPSVYAADIKVPYMAMLTDGHLNEAGAFVLSTRASMDLLFSGGEKFDAWFSLAFRHPEIEKYMDAAGSIVSGNYEDLDDALAAINRLENASGLNIGTIAIQMKRLFGTPLDLAVFVGQMDNFASGKDFQTLFGSKDFSTRFKDYMYYPRGIGGDLTKSYNGLHEVYGTGLRLSLPGDNIYPFLYLYQDSWLGAGQYSADIRSLFSLGPIKLEAFAGVSLPKDIPIALRTGLLFLFEASEIGEFYAQIGIPYWNPEEPFKMDLFYFMFEPRILFGFGEFVISLFFHPAVYLQQKTNESGAIELRFNLGFGKTEEGKAHFGLETQLDYNPNLLSNSLVFDIAPYLEFVKNGVRWDIRFVSQALPFSSPWYGMFRPMLGVSTAF